MCMNSKTDGTKLAVCAAEELVNQLKNDTSNQKNTWTHKRKQRERDVKYHVALLVTCACMMYTTRLQALSLPGKECMLADYTCVCDI